MLIIAQIKGSRKKETGAKWRGKKIKIEHFNPKNLTRDLQICDAETDRNYCESVSGSFSSVTIAPIVERIAKINTRHTQLATIPLL